MPFYQFDKFTGRLKDSTHFYPLFPLLPSKLENTDPPKMLFDVLKTKPASNVRQASGGVLPEKMLKTFEAYQKDLEYPVYKIRGTPDKILFGVTTALVVVGLGWSFSFIYRRAYPST